MSLLRRMMMTKKGATNSKYLTIEALEDGLTIKFTRNASEYCVDNGAWKSLSAGSTTSSFKAGQKIAFRIKDPTVSSSGIGTFTVSKKFNIYGNAMSMLYGDNAEGQDSVPNYAFAYLFDDNSNLLDSSGLKLPATQLGSYCYRCMFRYCTAMVVTLEELPATTLQSSCYYSMFDHCSALVKAPELFATTLADSCCRYMFSGCSALIAGPSQLLATSAVSYCYTYMFSGCSSLKESPIIRINNSVNNSLQYMFYNAKSLQKITLLSTNSIFRGNSSGATYNWVSGVASTGIFVKSKNAIWSESFGTSYIPTGWTVLTE